jgi:putative ABC transport system permease protein
MRYRRFLRLQARSREEIERDVDDELAAHLELRVAELIHRGESPERARAIAVERFGDLRGTREGLVLSARERSGRRRRSAWLDALRQDTVFALRGARRSPGHTLFAVAMLALAIGLTTGTFTVIYGALLRPLPFPHADRLYTLLSQDSTGKRIEQVSLANWLDWSEQNRTIQHSAIYQTGRLPVVTGNESSRVSATETIGEFFGTLQPNMLLGRGYTVADAQSEQRFAVVSEGLWRGLLGGDRSLSRPIVLSGRTYNVVGVVRAGYEYPAGTDVWVSRKYEREFGARRNWVSFTGIARLRDDVGLTDADRDLDAIAAHIRQSDPAGIYSYGVELRPLKSAIAGDAGRYLWLLQGAVGFVLLIACANLAGINLARGKRRTQEMAVRAALGAARARLIRQLLIEHVTLALLAGAAGMLIAWWSVRAVLLRTSDLLPRAEAITIDRGILAFAVVVALITGVITGLLPALQLSRVSLKEQMSGGQRGAVAGGRNLPGALLVGIEVAFALMLLTGGGLLMRSYRILLARDLGFDTSNVITAQIALGTVPEIHEVERYWETLLPSLRSIPGVEAVAASNWIPLGIGVSTFLDIEGRAETGGSGYRAISDDYFRTLGLPLLAGRVFDARDVYGGQRVGVISQKLADTYFQGVNPLGRRMRTPGMESFGGRSEPQWITIVGVVADMRQWGLAEEPRPELYVSYRQVPVHGMSMTALVRTRLSAANLMAAVRNRIREHDRRTPADLGTLAELLDNGLQHRRLTLAVLSTFGAIALALAMIGLYSLISFAVAQRTRELAVRAALGARRRNLLQMVFANAMAVVLLGVIAGLAGAAALTRLLDVMLVEVKPLDPLTLLVVTLCLLAAAALAILLPAVRAARLDPLMALRAE